MFLHPTPCEEVPSRCTEIDRRSSRVFVLVDEAAKEVGALSCRWGGARCGVALLLARSGGRSASERCGLIPLTPGNVGIASGAVTLALQARGIGLTEALTAGIALHAVETLVGLSLGAAGSLYVARARAPWALRLAAAGASVVAAAAFSTTVFFDLT